MFSGTDQMNKPFYTIQFSKFALYSQQHVSYGVAQLTMIGRWNVT